MLMRTFVLAIVASVGTGCGHAVLDCPSAIAAAHKGWKAKNSHIASQQDWQKNFRAERRGSEWAVWQDAEGNMAIFYVSARDGRLLRVEMND